MTILTALRTAATSAVAAKHLAPAGADTMAIIGNGAQSEFQALAFKAMLGIRQAAPLRHRSVRDRQMRPQSRGPRLRDRTSAPRRRRRSRARTIITTVTADKQNATILTDNMVGTGIHINAVGGDCPGKTELHRDILLRSDIFVEYPPQTRIEGEIQQLAPDHPVTELWQVITGQARGRSDARQITLFDSVGFAIEDFSALRYVRDQLARHRPLPGTRSSRRPR